ncbi:uncharacterized protein DSM5745_03233 [Aspergillus mulundensis]|uniref:Uncharacterized protein n=1 Tax=Aspergillus mulundensis TaxID=1810919 RepID=A0A3D8SK88_9EURO|nr:hypothetical protein DSM5745_03233 [Aspergillus mulundensis]RDW86591.1 hypothetical protein DSM5745_03233 [Aspergillus mulundensis]
MAVEQNPDPDPEHVPGVLDTEYPVTGASICQSVNPIRPKYAVPGSGPAPPRPPVRTQDSARLDSRDDLGPDLKLHTQKG